MAEQEDRVFKVGDVEFKDLEVPENLPGLGGEQSAVVFDFVGGVRTVQLQGAFPSDITWEGILLGSDAEQRANKLDKLRIKAEEILLEWSGFKRKGFLKLFEPTAHNQWHFTYRATFVSTEDQTGNGSAAAVPATPEEIVSQASNSLSNAINNPPKPFVFPATVTQPVSTLQSSVTSALRAAKNSVMSIPTTTVLSLRSQISSIRNLLSPLIQNSADPAGITSAISADNALSIMDTTLQQKRELLAKRWINNPNFPELAAAYYQDATLWQEIAAYNGFIDPMPTGLFLISIPADPQLRLERPVVFQ